MGHFFLDNDYFNFGGLYNGDLLSYKTVRV